MVTISDDELKLIIESISFCLISGDLATHHTIVYNEWSLLLRRCWMVCSLLLSFFFSSSVPCEKHSSNCKDNREDQKSQVDVSD